MEEKPYILVADDEPLNQMIVQSFLTDNYSINTVNNGMECINSLNANRLPDLIITDIEMPVMNGIDMCQLIKSNKSYQNIPIIFMSTLSGSEIEKNCKKAGGTHLFRKPVDKLELRDIVKKFIAY